MIARVFCLCFLPFMLTSCTIVGAALDSGINNFFDRHKPASEKRQKDNRLMKAGFEMDKALVKRAVSGGGEVEEQVIEVPSHCKPPFELSCSEKESVCVCVRDRSAMAESVKVVADD